MAVQLENTFPIVTSYIEIVQFDRVLRNHATIKSIQTLSDQSESILNFV